MERHSRVGPLHDMIHDLLLTHEASRKRVATILGYSPNSQSPRSMTAGLNASLAKGLSYDPLAAIARVNCRELDYFHIYVSNLESALRAEEALSLSVAVSDLGLLVGEVVDLFSTYGSERHIDIDLAIAETLLVRVDQALFFRAMANVIENAVKYSHDGRRDDRRFVSVKGRRHSSDGDVLISVESFGIGVLPEERERVFDYGVRGHLARDRHRKGSGVGLAETKRIVDAHGGSVRISSEAKGADVYLTRVDMILPRDPHPPNGVTVVLSR